MADDMRRHVDRAARLMRALANRHRLAIMCELLLGERSVGALGRAVRLDQSPLSQHLAKLRHEGLVKTRRESQTIHYRLAGKGAARVIEALHDVYCPTKPRR